MAHASEQRPDDIVVARRPAATRSPSSAYSEELCRRLDIVGGAVRAIAVVAALAAVMIGLWLMFDTETSALDGSAERPHVVHGLTVMFGGIANAALVYLAGLWATAWANVHRG